MKKGTTPRIIGLAGLAGLAGRDAFDVLFGGAGGIALLATALAAFFPRAPEAAGPSALTLEPANLQLPLIATASELTHSGPASE